MLLLLLYWSYLGICFINLGFGFQKITRIQSHQTILTIVFGMFATTIMASIWAIFGKINFEFQFFLIVLQIAVVVYYRKELRSVYQDFWSQIKVLSRKLKILLAVNKQYLDVR